MKKKHKFISGVLAGLVICVAAFLIFSKNSSQAEVSFEDRFEERDNMQYLVVGDSIGESVGASKESLGWTKLLNNQLRKTHNLAASDILLTKGGSNVFDGYVEFSEYQTSKSYDYVFFSYGVNDQKTLTAEQFGKYYNSLIQDSIKRFPDAVPVVLLNHGIEKADYTNVMKEAAEKYGALLVDNQQAFKESAKAVSKDGVHPNDKGYQMYAKTVYNTITKGKVQKSTSDVKKSTSTELTFEKKPVNNKGFLDKEKYYVSDQGGAQLTYEMTKGELLGISLYTNKDGGKFKVYAGDKLLGTYDAYSPSRKIEHLLLPETKENQLRIVVEKPAGKKEKEIVRIAGVILAK